MRLTSRFVFLSVVIGILLFKPDISEAAFGISPPFLNATSLLKGSRYVQTIYLVQDQPNQDLKIQAKLEISDRVRKWIRVNDGKEIIIPKGVRQFPVEILVNVPKNAELGAYRGTLSFAGVPDERTGQITVALGVQLTINLSIGTDIHRDFKIALVKFLDIEEGWAPRVLVKFNNEGNVPELVNGAIYELFDKFGAVRLAYVQEAKKLPEIEPFTIKEEIIEFPIDLHLGLGQYWGAVGLSQLEKVIVSQKGIFNVLKAGSLSNPTVIIWEHLRRSRNYYLIGLGVLLLGFLVFYRKKFLRRWRKLA